MEESLGLELELCGIFARQQVLTGFKIVAHKHAKITFLSKEKNSLKKKKEENIFWNYRYSYSIYILNLQIYTKDYRSKIVDFCCKKGIKFPSPF